MEPGDESRMGRIQLTYGGVMGGTPALRKPLEGTKGSESKLFELV